MFPSACSLRSTQCAALIALATAAGISRFETSPVIADDSSANPTRATSTATPAVHTTFFRLAVQAFAPWFHFFDVANPSISPVRESAGRDDAPAPFARPRAALAVLPPREHAGTAFPNSAARPLPLSAFDHAFPFAVGPPQSRITSTPRVEGTVVPSDSAARRILSLRIAANARPASPVARPVRLGNFALRGEPVPPLSADASAVALPATAPLRAHLA